MATAKKKSVRKKITSGRKVNIPKAEAESILADAPKRLSSAGGTRHHMTNLVRFREMDVDESLSKFINKVTKRGGFESPTDATLAMLRYLAHYVTRRGYGSFIPHVRKFKGKK
ncbi:unnamed protein product [marine sediment metagenome]|uniref:Uncharacterized protein n=1 Tax=marine sediment metagenome TaxID=412755 RepID=X0SD23_9ZZZZ